jgi:hypothetical protein
MPNSSECDAFYVGYLPLPHAIKRFIVPWLVGNFVLAIGIGAVIAQQHREPGDGVWETGEAVQIVGDLDEIPYPILRTENKTYLLVEQGKLGAQTRFGGLDMGAVGTWKVTGYLIEGEGRSVIELDGGIDNPLEQLSITPSLKEPVKQDLGTHTLRGEIVDPKCYLGVMQPGDGKTHKTCATLCIKGGIPPMLVVQNEQGETAAYLLTDAAGDAFPESHYEYIADPIEITGTVMRDGDLLMLRGDLASIRRLDAGE